MRGGGDPLHRYWSCPLLQDIGSEEGFEDVARTQDMRRFFDDRYRDLECLWGRGILPHSLWSDGQPDPTPETVLRCSTPGFEQLVRATGVAFSDGAGGPRHAPKSAPRMGCTAGAEWCPAGRRWLGISCTVPNSCTPSGGQAGRR